MINLNKHTAEITNFLKTSIDGFQKENGKPNSIGIYCCSWAGWISINFNIHQSLTESYNNCPDFEYVAFDLFEIPEMQDEYETDNPQIKINDSVKTHDHELGDEVFNQLIFDYLKPIVIEIKANFESDFLLQMLDSNFTEEL